MKRSSLALAATVAALLSGCGISTINPDSSLRSRVYQEVSLAKAAVQATAPDSMGVVEFSDDIHVPQLSAEELRQPDWFSTPIAVTFTQAPLGQLLRQVYLPHDIGVQLLEPELMTLPLTFNHQGSLGSLTQALQQQSGLHVDYDADQISWSQYQVAEFDVAFLSGATEFFLGDKAEAAGATGAHRNNQSGSRASINQTSAQYLNFSNSELSVWNDLEQALQLLLSRQGKLQINQSSTSVLVRDYPRHVKQIQRYLEQQNERLLRQVAIDVQILEVTFDEAEQFAIDWQAILASASGSATFGLTSASFTSGGVQGSQLSWQQQQGRAAGSQLFIEALQQQGVVRSSKQPRLLSLNNQIAKIVLQDNATYLAAAGSTSTANVGTASTLEPGVVTTGFELYVLPSIQAGQVILQLSTEVSDLQGIDEVRSGEQLIQTPHTQRKKFFMKALVADGETLLLSGLSHQREQQQQQQSWFSLLLGGSNHRSDQHSETLLLITPRIITRGEL